MITRHANKSCCGQKIYTFELDSAIKRSYLPAFIDAGYAIPAHMKNAGLFYVVKPHFGASASFGMRKVKAFASGPNAEKLLDEFQNLLDKLTSGK